MALHASLVLPRTLMGGTHAMRAAGEKFLPREKAEKDTDYKARLERSVLFNAYRKTVKDMAGKVFAKPIKLGDDMPEQLVAMAENIDMTGRRLDVFGFDVFKDGLQAGGSYILVDMPPAIQRPDGRPVTLADERAAKRRPYFVHIKAENMLGWKSETVNGYEQLTQVRILEIVSEPDGEWGEKAVEQVRVIERGMWRTYRKVRGNSGVETWEVHKFGPMSIGRIPIAPVYMNRTGFMTFAPPLEDLADLNAAHWRKRSDIENIEHFTCVPFIFGRGFSDDKPPITSIGAGMMVLAQEAHSDVKIVEHSGSAIGSARESLECLEGQMQAMGLELLIPKPGGQTATGKAIDQAAMNAPLQLMALALQDALEQAFGFAAEYLNLGTDAGGSITVNTDLGVSMRDAADLQALLAAANAGYISRERLLMEFQRRGVIADDVNPEEEAEKAKEEGPALGMIAGPPQQAQGDNEDDAEAA